MNPEPQKGQRKTVAWAIGGAVVGMLLAAIPIMLLGRVADSNSVALRSFALMAVFVVLVLVGSIYSKRRAARDPAYAARLEQVNAQLAPQRTDFRRRFAMRMLSLCAALVLIVAVNVWKTQRDWFRQLTTGQWVVLAVIGAAIALAGFQLFYQALKKHNAS